MVIADTEDLVVRFPIVVPSNLFNPFGTVRRDTNKIHAFIISAKFHNPISAETPFFTMDEYFAGLCLFIYTRTEQIF
jgi:hypothetical protein